MLATSSKNRCIRQTED